jgi:hypothetical protein
MTKSGITIECIKCKGRRDLSLEEAASIDDTPYCDRCLMPMVAVEARVNNRKGKANAGQN